MELGSSGSSQDSHCARRGEKREVFAQDLGQIFDMLKAGSEKARETASRTLDEVKTAMGINYFKGNSLYK